MKVALTIDDLPTWPHSPYPEGYTSENIANKIIQALDKTEITGVYAFSNSWPLIKTPTQSQIFDKWVQAGHHIGNHTHSHPNLNEVSAEEYIKEIDLAAKYLEPWLKKAPSKLFRYTQNLWGNTNEKLVKVKNHITSSGYSIAEMTTLFYEWDWNYAYISSLQSNDVKGLEFLKSSFIDFSVAQLKYDQVEAAKWSGHEVLGIIIIHNVPFFSEVVEELLVRLVSEGVMFISLEEAMTDPIYDFAASVVSDSQRALGIHQKLADAEGASIPRIVPEFEKVHNRVIKMGEHIRSTQRRNMVLK